MIFIGICLFFFFHIYLVAPQLRISFGTNIQTDSIREGSDVYMECRVKANPPVKEVVWLHEDRPIHSLMSGDPNMMPNDSTLPSLSSTSVSLGSTVIMTNQSLVIQKVHRSHRGRYQCVAFNEQGETISDPLYLKVNCMYCYFKTNVFGIFIFSLQQCFLFYILCSIFNFSRTKL